MVSVTLAGIAKRYGQDGPPVLSAMDLAVEPGELFFLLGPSGCGKSTLLRIVAGLLAPSAGSVHFGEQDVTRLPTEDRHTAMVFQNYALWPHMSVIENVRFGLVVRKTPKAEAEARAREALAMVGMDGYAERRPASLSGGQQQRVALARAMVVHPQVLLLDEPLSNLDAKLRLAMRREIRNLCKAAGLTAIYVTHDQKEALAMADRMAVLADGRLQQTGPPREIYRRPVSRLVADFIGEANFIPATVVGRDADRLVATCALGTLAGVPSAANFAPGQAATLLIRPEALSFLDGTSGADAPNTFPATIANGMFLGEIGQWTVTASGLGLIVSEQAPPGRHPGDAVRLHADPDQVVLLP
jgi:iron(III) transport system ATP-binding protein